MSSALIEITIHATGSEATDLVDLTGFQREIVHILGHHGETKGTAVQETLGERYGEGINRGRVYQNLDALVRAGYVRKRPVDGRTNGYRLTDEGAKALCEYADRLQKAASGVDA